MYNLNFYHLWLGHYESINEYDIYIGINQANTSNFAQDLGISNEYPKWNANGKIASLQPNISYALPLEEIFKGSPVRKQDYDVIKKICRDINLYNPNSYIWYFNEQLTFQVGTSFDKYKYIGYFEADNDFLESRTILYPQSFTRI